MKIEQLRFAWNNSSATTLSLGQGRGNLLKRLFAMKRTRTAVDNCAREPSSGPQPMNFLRNLVRNLVRMGVNLREKRRKMIYR